MAENENGQEKTEEATPKRLDKSRDEGQVPRSKELTTAFVLLSGVVGIITMGGAVGQRIMGIMRFNFSMPREAAFDTSMMMAHFSKAVFTAIEALAPFFILLAVAALIGPVALGGWIFSAKPLAPKLDRMDPLKGLQRMFSMNSLVELFKALAKFVLVASVAILMLITFKSQLIGLAQATLLPAVSQMLTLVGWAILAVSASMIVIALIDVPYQIYDHSKKLKMTLQEVKDEMKDTEGKPEVKGRIRQLQREMAQRRMMEAVPEADVVITNPEHFSVALKYDVEGGGAPIVVAKGTDFLAIKIREVANAHNVMILESATLARAIYFTTEIQDEIPGTLYLAVAQVLAYVFQLKAYKEGAGRRPKPLVDVDVPADTQYDVDGNIVSHH
ncbi:MAG: flagellar biosynthesis protein FlhB [Pseudomonadales bacterium]